MRPESMYPRNVTHEYVNAYQPLLHGRQAYSMMDYKAQPCTHFLFRRSSHFPWSSPDPFSHWLLATRTAQHGDTPHSHCCLRLLNFTWSIDRSIGSRPRLQHRNTPDSDCSMINASRFSPWSLYYGVRFVYTRRYLTSTNDALMLVQHEREKEKGREKRKGKSKRLSVKRNEPTPAAYIATMKLLVSLGFV